jgi:hypothetical protein
MAMMRKMLIAIATTVAMCGGAYAENLKAVCKTMVGDKMITLWIEADDATESLKVTNEKGETVSYGKEEDLGRAMGRLFDPQLMLIYTMVHERRCEKM